MEAYRSTYYSLPQSLHNKKSSSAFPTEASGQRLQGLRITRSRVLPICPISNTICFRKQVLLPSGGGFRRGLRCSTCHRCAGQTKTAEHLFLSWIFFGYFLCFKTKKVTNVSGINQGQTLKIQILTHSLRPNPYHYYFFGIDSFYLPAYFRFPITVIPVKHCKIAHYPKKYRNPARC